MRRPRIRRPDDTGHSLEQTPDESAQPATADGETKRTEVSAEVDEPGHDERPATQGRCISWRRVIAYGLLPGLALLLAFAGGFLKWWEGSVRDAEVARAETVQAATDGTITMLSYKHDTVEKELGAAQDRLTGQFKDAYGSLVHDVVIPGSRQKQISAVATVSAASSLSADANHGVVLVVVNQTVTVGKDAPTSTVSRVRVTLDKLGGRWLISQFDAI